MRTTDAHINLKYPLIRALMFAYSYWTFIKICTDAIFGRFFYVTERKKIVNSVRLQKHAFLKTDLLGISQSD